jgi:DNA-binding protein WhiA
LLLTRRRLVVATSHHVMPLSDDLRSELAAIAPRRGCCRLAEISALFHSAGSVHLRGRGEIALHLDLATSGVARRAFSLLRELGIHSEIRTYNRRAFDRGTRYQLHVTGDEAALAVLVEAGVLDARHAPVERPPKRVVGRACCRGAYLRGALLGGGSLSGPGSPHLELRTTSLEGAEFLRSVVAADDVKLGVLDRGRHAIAYAKGLDSIESVLSAAGAGDTVLAFEERSIVAAARGEANRLANADHANLVRTSRAAQEQLEAVRALQREGALERLPDRLHEVALLRLRHPTLPLRELAGKCEPPTTKASVHRRLRKLQELAHLE